MAPLRPATVAPMGSANRRKWPLWRSAPAPYRHVMPLSAVHRKATRAIRSERSESRSDEGQDGPSQSCLWRKTQVRPEANPAYIVLSPAMNLYFILGTKLSVFARISKYRFNRSSGSNEPKVLLSQLSVQTYVSFDLSINTTTSQSHPQPRAPSVE